jgi:hypothetical protein
MALAYAGDGPSPIDPARRVHLQFMLVPSARRNRPRAMFAAIAAVGSTRCKWSIEVLSCARRQCLAHGNTGSEAGRGLAGEDQLAYPIKAQCARLATTCNGRLTLLRSTRQSDGCQCLAAAAPAQRTYRPNQRPTKRRFISILLPNGCSSLDSGAVLEHRQTQDASRPKPYDAGSDQQLH